MAQPGSTWRRHETRVDVGGFCWEVDTDRTVHGTVLDLSGGGLCLERPFVGGATPHQLQLEFEVPGLDEVIWASAHVRFDRVVHPGPHARGGGLLRRTGLRLAALARRDLHLIQDYVAECRHRARLLDGDVFDFTSSTAFMRG